MSQVIHQQPRRASSKAATPESVSLPVRQPQTGQPGRNSKVPGASSPAVQAVKTAPAQRGAAVVLTSAQLAGAIAWYKANAALYTPQVIKRIQAKVGVPSTGKLDTATLQGIAQWQRTHQPLPIAGSKASFPVDGKATAALLSHMFPSGLAAQKTLSHHSTAMHALVRRWALLSEKERLAAIEKLLNEDMKLSGMPAVLVSSKAFASLTAAEFDFTNWQLQIGLHLLQQKTLTPEAGAELADTLYHELRHAEQWFKMAQLEASKGRDPAATLGLADAPARQAGRQPIQSGTLEAIQANDFYQSVYGTGRSHRITVLDQLNEKGTRLNMISQRLIAKQALYSQISTKLTASTDPLSVRSLYQKYINLKKQIAADTKKLDALSNQYSVLGKQYTSLPEEADAWRIGGKAGDTYRKTK